jgi:imidazoleglycerol-phosphate dehydratase
MANRRKRKPEREDPPPLGTFQQYEQDCRTAIAEMEAAYRARGEPVPKITFEPSLGILISLSDEPRDRATSPNGVGANAGRSATIQRDTAETRIELFVNLDGAGQAEVATGIGFFDHMLTLLAKHSLIDLKVQAKGDLHVDPHHTVEDVGICLGKALVQALGDKAGIRRYGWFTLPMDETLVTAAVDLGGRPYFAWKADVPRERLGEFPSELAEDFWQAVATNGLMNLHVLCHYGRNTHHIIEGIFKAVARALRQAVEPDPRMPGVPSTKGTLTE